MRFVRRGWLVAAVLAPALARAQSPRAPGSPPEIVGEARVDVAKEINFASGVWPSRLYVGQQATYEIGIFLSEEMRSRLRSNPQFVPPDVRSMIAYDLPVTARLFQRREGHRTYDVHVFSRALFPLTAGTQSIPPARLTYSVPLSNSIFSREESHSARSTGHALTVLEPPVAERPSGFQGAVGRLSVRARVDASDARVGDPMLLTLTVSGIGNVGLFPRPTLALPWGHAVAGTERVRVDSSAVLITGDKEFEWVVTPRVAGPQAIPPIRYPFFNPYTERYEVAVTQPLGIQVRPGALASPGATSEQGEPRLTLRRDFRGDLSPSWPTHPLFWVGVLLVPMPAAISRWRRRVRPVVMASPEGELEKLAREPDADVRRVRRLARAILAARVPAVRSHGAGDGAVLERTLRRAGVSTSTARDARRYFGMLDEVAYARPTEGTRGLASQAIAVLTAIDAEATPAELAMVPHVGRRWRAMGVVMFFVLSGGWLVAQGGDDTSTFAAGVTAYDAGDVALARQAFYELASRRPRAPDAWANLGTASWHAGDTASAVAGWQRALRLEPLAGDVRSRLGRTPSFRDGLEGDIPPIPVNGAAALGALLWIAGWGLAVRRVPARGWSLARTCVVASVLVGLGTVWLSERLRGERQVVVVSPDALRDAPAMAARRGASLTVGETGRVRATQGAWSRVEFADAREGWIDARRLESLEVPATP